MKIFTKAVTISVTVWVGAQAVAWFYDGKHDAGIAAFVVGGLLLLFTPVICLMIKDFS